MVSVGSRVGALQHRHEVERNKQEDDFAREEQQVRAKADRERQDLRDKQMEQARTPPKHAHRAPIVVPTDQQHAEARAGKIQSLYGEQAKKRKAKRESELREIEAERKKPATADKHAAPYAPEKHHPISVIWHDLDSARQQAVRGVMDKYARARDSADSDVLDLNKSQAVSRYAKAGTRTADDVGRKHEEAHLKIARDEYKELEGLRMKFERDLELERRKLADQAAEREAMARKHASENRMAR